MKTQTLFSNYKSILPALFFIGLTGCSSMSPTNSGFLTENHSASTVNEGSIEVVWKADNSDLSSDEIASLMTLLESEIESSVQKSNIDLSSVQLRAAITRIETVSPGLNWFSTIALIIPFDRGGAAVEFEALDKITYQPVVQVKFAQWTPLSEFSARFHRLEPAKLSLISAADKFTKELQSKDIIGNKLTNL